MHWVVAEAIGAAAILSAITGEPRYGEWLGTWWRYAQDHLVDTELGSWHAELGPDNLPHAGTWSGKPDVYHAYQAVLLTSLPPAGSVLAAVSRGSPVIDAGSSKRSASSNTSAAVCGAACNADQPCAIRSRATAR